MAETSERILVKDEVAEALGKGRPVLALESAIITHGLPWPRNLETARRAEQAARDVGVVPATLALIAGRAHIGLSPAELEQMARTGASAAKCSRRDIAPLLANGSTAGTTVAASLALARCVGIGVFATGGIGGVHRGAETSLDVSADLQELARTPVTVVCAGPKVLLDIRLTREYLETHGVPIIGYRTDELPAFYVRESGHGVDYRVDSPAQVAAVIDAQRRLGLRSGIVVANPPPESVALDPDAIEMALESALAEARVAGVKGTELTPYLLHRIQELTGGASLAANVALMENNAALGAGVARALQGTLS